MRWLPEAGEFFDVGARCEGHADGFVVFSVVTMQSSRSKNPLSPTTTMVENGPYKQLSRVSRFNSCDCRVVDLGFGGRILDQSEQY